MTTDKITTTLAKIRAASPCEYGYKKLVKSLGGVRKYGKDTPITFRQIYEINGYQDTFWCLRTIDKEHHGLLRHFACDCADDVRHLLDDKRSLKAIKVARRYADGLANDEELQAARDAAWAATRAATRDAAWVTTRDAARATSWDASWDAAWAATWAAAGAAGDAAWTAARASVDAARATGDAELKAQGELLVKYFG